MVIKMLTKHGRRMDGHSENSGKVIENKRKYETEVKIELTYILEGFNSRLDEVEEWISELEIRTAQWT